MADVNRGNDNKNAPKSSLEGAGLIQTKIQHVSANETDSRTGQRIGMTD